MKIVFCEDDQILQEQVASLLRWEGYEVETCSSLEALYAKLDHHPDLLLLDVHLDDGCVYDMIRIIRQENPIPILLLSADLEESVILEGYQLDCLDYIEKPVRPRILLARIHSAARREGLLDPILFRSGWQYRISNGELSRSKTDAPEQGESVCFHGSAARAFELLFRAAPDPIAKAVLRSCFSSNCSDATLRVRLSEMRKALPDSIRIVNIRTEGYRLVFETDCVSREINE